MKKRETAPEEIGVFRDISGQLRDGRRTVAALPGLSDGRNAPAAARLAEIGTGRAVALGREIGGEVLPD